MNLVSEERDCGCLLGNNTVTKEVFISYCPKHAAAPEMFEALRLVITWDNRTEDHIPWWKIMRQIEAAIEAATGGSDD